MPRLFNLTEYCDCGTSYLSKHRARHCKSNHHRNWLATRNSVQSQHSYDTQPTEYYQEQYNQYQHQPSQISGQSPITQQTINTNNCMCNEPSNPDRVEELIREMKYRFQLLGFEITSLSLSLNSSTLITK